MNLKLIIIVDWLISSLAYFENNLKHMLSISYIDLLNTMEHVKGPRALRMPPNSWKLRIRLSQRFFCNYLVE